MHVWPISLPTAQLSRSVRNNEKRAAPLERSPEIASADVNRTSSGTKWIASQP